MKPHAVPPRSDEAPVKREGAYSRDPLTHAENVIDDMESIAIGALASLPSTPEPK